MHIIIENVFIKPFLLLFLYKEKKYAEACKTKAEIHNYLTTNIPPGARVMESIQNLHIHRKVASNYP